jgi:hypothetical protein
MNLLVKSSLLPDFPRHDREEVIFPELNQYPGVRTATRTVLSRVLMSSYLSMRQLELPRTKMSLLTAGLEKGAV